MKHVKQLLDKLPYNSHLRPLTAQELGFEWVMDIGGETPDELWDEITDLVTQQGYMLGQPNDRWARITDDAWLRENKGLYKPLLPSHKH